MDDIAQLQSCIKSIIHENFNISLDDVSTDEVPVTIKLLYSHLFACTCALRRQGLSCYDIVEKFSSKREYFKDLSKRDVVDVTNCLASEIVCQKELSDNIKLLKEIGVELTCCGDLFLAREILSVCAQVKKRGLMLPKEIEFVCFDTKEILAATENSKEAPIDNKVLLQYEFWLQEYRIDHSDDLQHREFQSKIKGTLLHEFGHYNHFIKISGRSEQIYGSFKAIRDDYANGLAMIMYGFSQQARTDPFEFVAETFVGLAIGETYNDRIMSIYRILQGPEFPKTKK